MSAATHQCTPSTRRGPVGVAVIGAGNISKAYLDNLTVFPDLKVLVIADLFEDAAEARAKEYGIPEWGGVDAALNHPDVEIIVNLTIPAAHVEVATAAVNAGKHVWTEKPFALDRESGLGLLKTADAAGFRLGCAPDTFLGASLQTARRIIERGHIGTPLTALTMFQTLGPESWHPNPAFLFARGAGPLFDMGPYYITALVQTFGSVRRVAAVGSKAKEVRVVGSGPKAGEEFPVEIPTHVSAMLQFEGGQSSHSVFSFESPACGWASWRSPAPRAPLSCRIRTSSTATSSSGAREPRNRKSFPPRARPTVAGWACWIWPVPFAPVFRTAPREPLPTTWSIPWCPFPSPPKPAPLWASTAPP